jgi:hypothetical protein
VIRLAALAQLRARRCAVGGWRVVGGLWLAYHARLALGLAARDWVAVWLCGCTAVLLWLAARLAAWLRCVASRFAGGVAAQLVWLVVAGGGV